jgi:DNA-binding CsgD family transcriptional regulator
MSASLCIQVFSEARELNQQVQFFEADEWTMESEQQLLLRVQELLGALRTCSNSLDINISFKVTDLSRAMFLIQKKIHNEFPVQQQKLSMRELEVLKLIMQGLTNQEIADKLFIAYETVKSHRKHILEKTGSKNTAALVNHYNQAFFEK